MTQFEKVVRGAPPPPPVMRSTPQNSRRSVHQKYPPLLNSQLNYEVHTEPPTSPKHEESKIAHNGQKKPPRHSDQIKLQDSKQPAARSLAKELQLCKMELVKLESLNAKLISNDATIGEKLKQAEIELTRAKEERNKFQTQCSLLQSKVLKLAAQNERLKSEKRDELNQEEEINRLRIQNIELKNALEGSSDNALNQAMKDELYELLEGISGDGGDRGEVSALRGQLMRSDQVIENQKRQIEELKELLDEKENRITTPKSSRERTPQNHTRKRIPDQQLQSHQLLDFGGNEEEDQIEAMPRRQRMDRVFSGEEESKTPPTSTAYQNLVQLDQDLLNEESPLDMAQPGSIPPQQLSPFPSFGIGGRPEELVLRNQDVQQGHTTPRTNQPYDERGRGSRASTPSKDQADTPTRQSQRQNQQLVHNLSSNQIFQRLQQPNDEEQGEEEEDGVEVIPNSYFFN